MKYGLVCAFAIFAFGNTLGQVPHLTPPPTTYRPTYNFNNTRNDYYQRPYQHPVEKDISVTTTYKITFANDSVFVVMATLDKFENYFLNISTRDMERTLLPKETVSIEALVDNQYLKGVAVDSCWLFKTGTGKINYYSALPHKQVKYAMFIQHGENDPIVPLTRKALAAMIDERYEKIHALIDKDKLARAITEYNKLKD